MSNHLLIQLEGWKGGRLEEWKGKDWKDGRKNGRREEKMEGWKEGRKDGRMEGGKKRWKDGAKS